MNRYNVSASQLGWMLADCERCFVREARYGVRRPGGPPDAFAAADKAMKNYFASCGEICHQLGVGPPFTLIAQNIVTESRPIEFHDLDLEIVLRGRLDALVRDDTGRVIVVDYKTKVKEVPVDRIYAPQLHAYALGLENPVAGVAPQRVDGLALLIYSANKFAFRAEKATSGLFGATEWINLIRDDEDFYGLLHRAAQLLAGAEPKPTASCAWCRYYGAVPIGGAA